MTYTGLSKELYEVRRDPRLIYDTCLVPLARRGGACTFAFKRKIFGYAYRYDCVSSALSSSNPTQRSTKTLHYCVMLIKHDRFIQVSVYPAPWLRGRDLWS